MPYLNESYFLTVGCSYDDANRKNFKFLKIIGLKLEMIKDILNLLNVK